MPISGAEREQPHAGAKIEPFVVRRLATTHRVREDVAQEPRRVAPLPVHDLPSDFPGHVSWSTRVVAGAHDAPASLAEREADDLRRAPSPELEERDQMCGTVPMPALLPTVDVERERLGQIAWLLEPGKIEAARDGPIFVDQSVTTLGGANRGTRRSARQSRVPSLMRSASTCVFHCGPTAE